MNFIGLSGVAKAGKDTFCQGLKDAYPEYKIQRISVGDIIRSELRTFLENNFGINVFNCSPEQKKLIRPLLAWYGDLKRKQTDGRYFIDLLEDSLKWYEADCLVLTDLRFKEFPFDETDWIHSKGGKVVHIKRKLPFGEGFAEPANDLERINDPKVQAVADVKVEWETLLPSDHFETEIADRVRRLGLLEPMQSQKYRN